MKKITISSVLCLLLCFINLTSYSQVYIYKYPFEILYDTLQKDNYVLLKLTINADKNKITTNTYFKNSDEFSFYNSESYDTTVVELNGLAVKPKFGSFDVYRYIKELNDTLMYVKKENQEYFFLLGKPFFCNGVNCSTVYLTAISKVNEIVQGIDIETKYDEIPKVYQQLSKMVKCRSFNLNSLKKIRR